MSQFATALQKWGAELRSNRRLLLGLALIALVVAFEGAVRWRDALVEQQSTLARLQTELATLRSQARDEAALRKQLADVKQLAASVDARLWAVSSEAVGQARLKDWLTEIVQKSIADQYSIVLAASREVGVPGSPTEGSSPRASTASARPQASGLREFRATVSFIMTPQALEGVLLAIEGGQPFAMVETLNAKAIERRVEMTVRVLMRIKPEAGV
jgi:hypothetical protein